jgi:hypothetical protein
MRLTTNHLDTNYHVVRWSREGRVCMCRLEDEGGCWRTCGVGNEQYLSLHP